MLASCIAMLGHYQDRKHEFLDLTNDDALHKVFIPHRVFIPNAQDAMQLAQIVLTAIRDFEISYCKCRKNSVQLMKKYAISDYLSNLAIQAPEHAAFCIDDVAGRLSKARVLMISPEPNTVDFKNNGFTRILYCFDNPETKVSISPVYISQKTAN